MYQCEISKAIWKDKEQTEIYKVLVKHFELPFAPYIGLSVSTGRFKSGEVIGVDWDIDKNKFLLYTNEETPWEDQELHLHTAEEITNHFTKRFAWDVLE